MIIETNTHKIYLQALSKTEKRGRSPKTLNTPIHIQTDTINQSTKTVNRETVQKLKPT